MRKHTHPTESQEQAAVIAWWRLYCHHAGIEEALLLHIPNEGRRSWRQGRLQKALGLRAGIPDLFLAVPRPSSGGLWIEMKSVKGHPSVAQKWWINTLRQYGYATGVCYGADQAINSIKAYLKG